MSVHGTENGEPKKRVSLNTFVDKIQPFKVAKDFEETFIEMYQKKVEIPHGFKAPDDYLQDIVFRNIVCSLQQKYVFSNYQFNMHDVNNPDYMDLSC